MLFAGCHKSDIILDGGGLLPDGRVRLELTLNDPNLSEVTTRSTNNNFNLAEIKNLHILVFEMTAESDVPSDVDKLLEHKAGVVSTSTDPHFHIDLMPQSGRCHMQVIINASNGVIGQISGFNVVGSGTPATYADYKRLSEGLDVFYKSSANIGEIKVGNNFNLNSQSPMLSSKYLANGFDQYSGITLDLISLGATIKVDASAPYLINYEIIGAQLLQGVTIGRYVTQTTTPATVIEYKATLARHTIPAEEGVVSPIRLFPRDGGDGTTTAIDIIIEGAYTDSKDNSYNGFHKIRIQYKDTPEALNYIYDIVRNTRYTVNITKVNSAGYKTLADAKLADPTNTEVEYDITINDDKLHDIVTGNGAYYMGFSNSEFIIYNNGAQTDLVATTFNFGLNKSTEATNGGVSLPAIEVIASDGITVTSALPEADIQKNITINLTADFIEGNIDFRLGNIAHRVKVVKRAILEGDETRLNAFDGDEYVFGIFEKAIPMVDWLWFTNAQGSNSVSSDTGGIPISLTANFTTTSSRKTHPFYLSRKDGKSRVKIIIVQYFIDPYHYDLDNDTELNRANSYILPKTNDQSYLFSINRIADYWTGTDAVYGGNTPANTIT